MTSSDKKDFEVLRAAEEWQRAGAYAVRVQGMNRQYHISLREEFDEHDCDSTRYIVLLDDGYPVATCRFFEQDYRCRTNIKKEVEASGVAGASAKSNGLNTDISPVEIGRVVVLPEYRGRGLGSRTVREAEAWIRELGYQKITIYSRLEAIGFYEKLGYTKVNESTVQSGPFACVEMYKNFAGESPTAPNGTEMLMKSNCDPTRILYGAMLGDMIGAPYEFDQGDKTKEFELFDRRKWVRYTDDTVMTVAIARGILEAGTDAGEEEMKSAFIAAMQDLGNRYAGGEYGGRFSSWLKERNPQPYGSFGNGSAMRVSPVGWCFDTLERTREVARWSAEVTHNHPEGVKGAESVAAAIFLLRNGTDKATVRQYIIDTFGYDLSRTCDEIRPGYHHVESCQETVPEAMTAFFEGTDFEDVIRTAVSLGGDCDTLTAIAGSLAEACYPVPAFMKRECEGRLEGEFLKTIDAFAAIAKS